MASPADLAKLNEVAHLQYGGGRYREALQVCEKLYELDAYRPDNLLRLGGIHFQLRNFSESIFYLQQCVRIEPTCAEAYSNLGNAIKELGDLAGAVQFYLKAIKLKPRFYDAYNNLALVYTQQGDVAQALQTYQMALVLHPNLVEAHCNLGNLYKAQGNLGGARRSYLEAIRIKPDFAIAWSNLAGVFKEEGQLATSVAYYREAIRLAPHFADAYSNLGNALKEQGNLDEATSCYKAAIAIRPDFAIAHGNLGSCYYDKGMLPEAIKTFKHAVQLEPNFPDCYNNLGNALREFKGNNNSVQSAEISTSSGGSSSQASAFGGGVSGGGGGGRAHTETEAFEEAVYSYRTALKLKPDHPHAYNNLGNAMKEKGLVREALHCFVTAARLMPKFAAAHSNIGCLLRESGKVHQALAHFHEAVSLDPTFADAYSNMGTAYRDVGKLDGAVKCFVAAIQLQPSFSDAYANLGACYVENGELSVAIECYRRALTHCPTFAGAEAGLCWAQLLRCEDWEGLGSRVAGLLEITQLELAIPGAAMAMATTTQQPGSPPRDNGGGGGLGPASDGRDGASSGVCGGGSQVITSFRESSKVDSKSVAARAAAHTRKLAGDNYQGGTPIHPSQLVLPLPSVQPFQAVAYGPHLGFDKVLQQGIARRYASRASANATAMSDLGATTMGGGGGGAGGGGGGGGALGGAEDASASLSSSSSSSSSVSHHALKHRPRKPGKRLHVGYVSSDFANHPVGHLAQGLFKCHDRTKVLVTAYCLTPHDMSQYRRRVEQGCERCVDLSALSNEDAAKLINSDSVHVLVDLNGYSKGARTEIFALKPAPIQVHLPYGFCGTLGAASFMDYVIGDACLVPREAQELEFVDEKVAYMPHSFSVGAHRDSSRFMLDVHDDKAPVRSDYGLPEDKFVFCNFNQLRKVTPQVMDVWCSVLKRVPNSLLWLLRSTDPACEENVRDEARKRGVKADQLLFSDPCGRDEHIRRAKLAELFVDTPNTGSAHTTCLDCLWAGTPAVTVCGSTMATRVGSSLLSAAHLQELCCESLASYEETCVSLAEDDNRYMRIRTHLEMDRETLPLFDNKRWVANAEAAFEMMWERHEQGLRPDHLTVPDVVGQPTPSGLEHNDDDDDE